MKDSSKTNQERIAEISVLKKRILELEQTSSEKIRGENERRASQLTVLHETSVELTAELSLDTLLHSIAQRALNLIGGAACNCYLYNPQTDLMERAVSAGTALIPSPTTRQRGEGMVGQVWVKGTPLLVNDYASWPGRTRAYDAFPSRALVAAPFRWGTEILGVLNIMAPLPHQYTRMDVEMLNLFAAQAAIAIRNAQLHDRMKMELEERKLAEEALRESEERYRVLVESASDIVFRTDATGHFTFINPAALRITGYEEKEIIGRHYPTLIRQDMREAAMRFFGRQFVKGIPNTYSEYPVIVKDGREIWLGQNTQLIFQGGNVIAFQAVARDITDRKQAEEALRRSETKYQFLAESMADVVFTLDMNLVTTYVSPSIERMLGYTPEERVAQKVDQQLTLKSQKLVFETLAAELDREKEKGSDPERFRTLELEYYHKDGSVKHLVTYIRGIRDSEGNLTGFYGSHHDITDRKRAEEALRTSEERHRAILQTAMDGIWLVDMRGALLEVNQTYCRMSGYSEQELQAMCIQDLEDVETENDTAAHIQKIMAQGEDRFESRHRRKDGTIFDVEVSVQYRSTDGGQFLVFLKDITERKTAEQALIESEKRLKMVTDNVPALIGYVDNNYRYRFVNKNYEKWFGLKQEAMLGMSIKELLPLKTYELSLPFINRALAGEEVTFEGAALLPNGATKVFYNNLVPDRSLNDEIIGYYVLVSDITDRKQAEQKLQETLERLRKAINTTIQAMVSAVETRDPYTSGHQIRSADLARAIASEMRFSPEKIEGIRMAASIHDIGKLSIPAEILSKPTKLSELEFALIKEHARKGYEMLKDVESPWPLAEIVRQHHERIDGSGYPRNLKGDDIIMEARILAVADVVEAMASHRPYRPGLGIDAALNEIEKNSGIFYDAAVANACLRLFREKGYKLEGT